MQNLVARSLSAATGATARKGLFSLLDQGVVSGTNFFASVLIGRALSREQFGLYELAFTVVTLAVNLQNALVTTPYTVYSPRLSGRDRAGYAGSTLVHQLGFSALAALVLAAAGLLLLGGAGPGGLGPIIHVLSLMILFMLLREYARRVCFAHLRMKTALLVDSAAGALQLAGIILLMALGLLSVGRAYLVAGLACALAAALGLALLRRQFAVRLSRAASDLARNWKVGRWMLASTIGATASAELYPWFLVAFHGAAATGVWAACSRVVFLANPFLMGLANLLGPQAAHAYARGRAHLDRMVVKAAAVVVAAMLVFFIAMLLFGGWLLQLMYPDKYVGWDPVVAVLALRHVLAALSLPVNCALLAIERADVVFKSYIAGAALAFGLGVPLTRAFGVSGAAWAMVASTAATTIFRHWSYWFGTRRALQASQGELT